MSSTNREMLEALRNAFPHLFTCTEENGIPVERIDLEKVRLLVGDGNYRDKYGLRWENKPEQFDIESVDRLPSLLHVRESDVAGEVTKPTHVLIKGDNYHALKVLAYTHEQSVDVAYIDPPYNTGLKNKGKTDFKYNDTFVDSDDEFKHSKWLSFMAKRLRLAKRLLKDTGVILVSINEYEFGPLKLLMDDIFGEQNSIIHWKTRGTGGQVKDGALVRQVEYILAYFKDKNKGKFSPTTFSTGEENWISFRKTGGKWQRTERPNQFYPIYVEPLTLRLSLSAHPGFTAVYPLDASGVEGFWHNAPDTAEEKIRAGKLRARLNTKGALVVEVNNVEEGKALNDGTLVDIPSSKGAAELADLALEFENPKPTDLLLHLLKLAGAHERAVVLDFFAGSGSTAHAVMRLNEADGGQRQCILVTNDEGEFKDSTGHVLDGGICTHVTHPRLKKVIEGYVTPKGKAVAGLGENLACFQTSFQPVPMSRNQLRSFVRVSTSMLCLKAGCFSLVEGDARWSLFEGAGKHLLVLFDEYAGDEALERLRKVAGPVDVYVFAYDVDDDTAELLGQLPNVQVQEVPKPLLDVFSRIKE